MLNRKLAYLIIVAAALCAPATASAALMHVVARGESLSSIAAQDGLSVDQLAAANGLSPSAQLIAGSSVAIPPQSAPADMAGAGETAQPAVASDGAGESTAAPAQPSSAGGYLVAPGDTLSAIAARYGVSVSQLAAANGLNPSGLLLAGSHLSVPGAAAPATVEVSAPVSNDNVAGAGTGAQPTAETVSPSEVGSIASAAGVPAS